jgi:hypothetical protein
VHTNFTGDLTSSEGNSGPAAADLTVDATYPGFSKSFAPANVLLGGRSTLTFTIDNTLNVESQVPFLTNLTFVDSLPVGLEVAGPANVINTCLVSGIVTAAPGSSQISLSGAAVAAGNSCTISVDVVSTGVGKLENTTSDLTFLNNLITPAGRAGAVLTSTAAELALIKEFVDDPVPPGSNTTLRFTITNHDRNDSATGITFTDDLDGTLAGLIANNTAPPLDDVCGTGSMVSGSDLLTMSGGTLAPGESCTFDISLDVPVGASPGAYPNSTSAVQSDQFTGNAATDILFVDAVPSLVKTFLDSPVAAGGSTRLEFTVTNTSPTSSATDISFIDELTTFLPFPVSAVLPVSGFCGAGATMSLVGVDSQSLSMTGGDLAANASCTFVVTLNLPNDLSSGTYTNTSQVITAVIDDSIKTGNPATADFDVVGGPTINKEFIGDPVLPGSTVTLHFTLQHDAGATGDATGISFSDDLDAALTGLVATGLPLNNVCGAGSQISGASTLTLTGGTLAPGEGCQFDVSLQVPASVGGIFTNTTSDVTSTITGLSIVSPPATDDLIVSGLTFSKSFTNDPVIPGAEVTLEFTIDNTGVSDASGIFFQDNLTETLSGLTVNPGSVPATPCGPGSAIALSAGDTLVTFSEGSLTAGVSCTFSLTLNVPGAAVSDQYMNRTSPLIATVDGNSIALPIASDTLTVAGDILFLTKTFLTNPVIPGATVDLEFEITNLSSTESIFDIGFTDDLNAALTGLKATNLPTSSVCGASSEISGEGLLTFTGGELNPGSSCTFSVTLQVPTAPASDTAVNTTSDITGLSSGELNVTGYRATDTLQIQNVAFSKAFASPIGAGSAASLTFTLTNLSSTHEASGLAFLDDLGAMISGATASNLPPTGFCGPGSTISGTSVITFTGGSLPSGDSCSFTISVNIPISTAAGNYPNTTSNLTANGLLVALPASDNLAIQPPPGFSKSFSPDTVPVGGVSTLTFTVDNAVSILAADNLSFTDNLPVGLQVAAPSNASTTCVGGTLTAVTGSSVISYSSGSVSSGVSCTLSVDVQTTAAGTFVNTSGDLTSSLGDSGTSNDSITALPAPVFSKLFSPDIVSTAGITTLTFTIDNSLSGSAATSLFFNDNLPSGLVVSTTPNAATTCTGGTLTATASSTSISYTGGTVAGGSVCAVSVDVAASATGVFANTSEALTSSLGNSGVATASLTVEPPPVFSKTFSPDALTGGYDSRLNFTIDNSASSLSADALTFTDTLPTGMHVASTPNAVSTCTGGTLTADSDSLFVSYSDGSVAAGLACIISVNVVVDGVGSYLNESGNLTSNRGNSGIATDTLSVQEAAVVGTVSIPTMNIWGLILLAALLTLVVVIAFRFSSNRPIR